MLVPKLSNSIILYLLSIGIISFSFLSLYELGGNSKCINGLSAIPFTSIIRGFNSGAKFSMLADSILSKSCSTSSGENLTTKLSSQPAAIDPFFGIIVYGPASKIPV
jgi:hypothetical protein